MSNIIEQLEAEQINKELPDFPGRRHRRCSS